MERIIILGCSGSGKTTLARRLGQVLNLPVVHLDKAWWTGNWENVTTEAFDQWLSQELEKPQWIMDGNYSRTIPSRLRRCDTAIFLDFPRWLCLWGAVQRLLAYHGKTRPDMGGNCPERIDWEFFRWIWNFNRDNRSQLYALLDAAPNVQKIVLKNRSQVRSFVRKLEENHEA